MRISDWSSDVCSSDLTRSAPAVAWLCSALCRSLWAGGANSRANPCDADDVSRERPRLYSFADQIMSSDLRDEERCIQSSTAVAERSILPAEPLAVRITTAVELTGKIGRASCRARVCQYVEFAVVAVSLKKK